MSAPTPLTVPGLEDVYDALATAIDQAAADYAELVERGQGEADTSALITLKRERPSQG